ncbi:MAG: shikimate dehydrogenase [Acidimicrobiia bacterium]|nr:shikimate dehydrogenase [Acidimicrobiia bacterium]
MITGHTRLVAVIGAPVRHSRSPVIHNAAFAAAQLDWVYVALEVPPGRGAEAIRALPVLGLTGVNVTMPHKADAARACDELTPVARALGSVNTVVVRDDGSCFGASTDGEGFLRALADEGLDPAGRSVLVLGAGGAARAVAEALVRVGAEVAVASRRPEAAREVAAAIPGVEPRPWPSGAAGDAEIVVNATPIGMGDDPTVPLPPLAGQWIVDLVYHPLETNFLREAMECGAKAIGGLGMLVHQAALAFELWTGVSAPLEAMRDAARSAQ